MKLQVIVTRLADPPTELVRARLRSVVRTEMAHGNVAHIVDLRELSSIDASTLAEIIRVRRWLREVGGSLTLVANQPAIMKILTIAGLDRLIGVYPDERAASAAFGMPHLVSA
jgi:anti-anti-sigma factor